MLGLCTISWARMFTSTLSLMEAPTPRRWRGGMSSHVRYNTVSCIKKLKLVLQHGDDECYGNMVQACAQAHAPDYDTAVR